MDHPFERRAGGDGLCPIKKKGDQIWNEEEEQHSRMEFMSVMKFDR